MERYALEKALHRIDGYYVPRPNESSESAFLRAQADCLTAMQKAFTDTAAVTYEQFTARRSGVIAAEKKSGGFEVDRSLVERIERALREGLLREPEDLGNASEAFADRDYIKARYSEYRRKHDFWTAAKMARCDWLELLSTKGPPVKEEP